MNLGPFDSTIHQFREPPCLRNLRLFRREGWVTPLGTDLCPVCGETVLGPPRAVYHDRCQQQQANAQKRARLAAGIEKPSTPYVRRWRQIRPEQAAALRAREREKARAAYHELPPEQQAAILARAHQSDQAGYTETLKRATSSGRVWTPEEDEYVRAHLTMPARDVGVRLGRTLWAVRNRRNKLRRDADEQRTLT